MKRLPPLNALKAFAVAARVGSFTLAGEALHVTQGAISRQIKLLETSLGVPLFVRSHQSVELTPTGRELAETLQRLFGEMEVAVNKAAGQQRSQMLSVNVPPPLPRVGWRRDCRTFACAFRTLTCRSRRTRST